MRRGFAPITNMEREKKTINKNALAIFLCWLVYTCSYIGKLGYNANITQIENAFAVTHAQSGSVGTAFFFAYGAGQIVNGLFCKKYNKRYAIFVALLISSVCNLSVPFITNFSFLKYVWFLNGAALSCLWAVLAGFLSENLDEGYIAKSVMVMGTTVACGTFAVYGLSALFVKMSVYKSIFYVAAAALPIVAALWFILYPSLCKQKSSGEKYSDEERKAILGESKKTDRRTVTVIILLGFFAVATNLIKDGITVWIPTMLKEIYSTPDYLSILLTLCLPLVAVFGTAVAVFLNKYVKSFVSLCGVLFVIAAVAIGVNLLFGEKSAVVLIACLCAVSLVMAGTNNVITSMAPLTHKGGNAGMIAGILNGCSYLGSTISSYGLGKTADSFGWNGVFLLLAATSVVCIIISAVYTVISKISEKRGA